MPARPRVLIMDPHRVVGASLALSQPVSTGLQVVGVVDGLAAAAGILTAGDVDVILLDPGTLGTRCIRQFRDRHHGVRLVVLTHGEDAAAALQAVRAGVSAWIPKDLDLESLVEIVRAVAAGGCWFPPLLLGAILPELAGSGSSAARLVGRLTARERQVLSCLVEGLDRRSTAERLVLSPHTVRTHVENLVRKLEVHSGPEAVAVAIRAGLT